MKKIHIIAAAITVLVIIAGLFIYFKRQPAQAQGSPAVVSVDIAEAENAVIAGDLVKAKQLYQQARESADDPEKGEALRVKVEDLNTKILFSPAITGECAVDYQVQAGDALAKIARKFNTTVGLIKRINSLSSDNIKLNQKLKVNTCKFSVVVDKSQNLLFLKSGDEVVKTYLVSTGANNSTPVGKFTIVNKLENPTWYKSGAVIPANSADNILGSRWMGFDLKGYGIHGTTIPQDLGKQVTAGCVRMRNEEVDELYDIIPAGAEVVIVD